MALRYRRLREISRLLPQIHSGGGYIQCRSATKLAALSIISRVYAWERNGTRMPQSRFSTTSEISYNSTQELDLLSFIKWSLDEREGPCHCWLNRSKGNRHFLGRDGTFLVLAGRCETFLTTCESVVMLEKVKSLQQRYPQLHVMGFLSGSSVSLAAARSHLIQYVVKEYVTFPVILSNRTFPEVRWTMGPATFYSKILKVQCFTMRRTLISEFLTKGKSALWRFAWHTLNHQ